MALMTLHDAIAAHVQDGQTIAMEGFTHLIPFAAGHEIIRQGRGENMAADGVRQLMSI